jgi:acetoin utilization deacetylase AcuC-like enzyme
MNSKVGYVYDKDMEKHCDIGHVERPERTSIIYKNLDKSKLIRVPSREATTREVLTCHNYTEFTKFSEQSNSDMYYNKHTKNAAYLALGSTIALSERIQSGDLNSGFAIVRPPGHHACSDKVMGFCFFNNVAVTAKLLQKKGEKVLIVDWDIHHGNGTQNIVENNEGIVYYSIHRYDYGKFYPGTGKPGLVGNTINVGLNEESGDSVYIKEIKKIKHYLKILEFKPTMIIVSCGFDAAVGDPLGGYQVTPVGYYHLTTILQNICSKIMIVLEGGYNITSIRDSALACIDALQDYHSKIGKFTMVVL